VDKTIAKIERLNLILLGAGALAGVVIEGMHVPSFLLGGGIMHVNFWLLKKIVQVVFARSQAGMGGKVRAALWFSAKGVLFLLLSSALFIRYPVHAESFTVGVSLLLLACVIVSLPGLWTPPFTPFDRAQDRLRQAQGEQDIHNE
jgi:hypothetical protein